MRELLSILPLVGIFLLFWLLLIRPASRRQRELQAMQRALTVGDRIVLTSGIYGVVTALDDDTATVEVADGVALTVARGAIGTVRAEGAATPTEGPASGGPEEN